MPSCEGPVCYIKLEHPQKPSSGRNEALSKLNFSQLQVAQYKGQGGGRAVDFRKL